MTAWRWLRSDLIYAVHDRQLAEHGGPSGVREEGAVESALALPQNLDVYGKADAADLAAAYAFGIARNHGFVDGNKRTAWVAARLFLFDNGFRLTFDPIDAVRTVEALASGNLSEDAMATWFRSRIQR